jgi:uncharacterized protein involved in exopolysaccharide biosynthesis
MSVAALARALLVERWKEIGAVTALIFAPVAAAAWLLTPIYRAETSLVPQSRITEEQSLTGLGGSIGGLGSLFGIATGGDAGTEYAIAVLKSTAFTKTFIEKNELLPVLFADKWDAGRQDWREMKAEDVPTILGAVRRFDEDVRTVLTDPKTGVIRVRVEWTDRETAAVWANALVQLLNETVRARAISDARARIQYLNRELASAKVVELRTSLSRVLESELKREMLANVTEDYAFRILDPAFTPDADDYVSPNRPLMLLAGLVVALFISTSIAAVRHQNR